MLLDINEFFKRDLEMKKWLSKIGNKLQVAEQKQNQIEKKLPVIENGVIIEDERSVII